MQDTPIHPDINGAGALIKRPTVLKSLSANTGGDTVRAKTDINILIKKKQIINILIEKKQIINILIKPKP